jgi:hypothetical protein
VIDLGRTYAAGAYEVSLATGDTSFDIYAVSEDGNSVGYTNDSTLVTSGGFTQLAILGVSSTERITFSFSGASNDATGEGTLPGAGAYLESISPSDLPNIDDTANVIGGNFATDVEIYFESGSVSTEAKNVVRSDSTSLVVTRPDELDPALDPWDLKAINPGVTPPVGSDAHILEDAVDAGAVPVWVTTSPLSPATINQSYTETLEATDADGSVSYSIVTGSLPTGLSLDTSTGVISGTPTSGAETFTVEASDEGGNSNTREFTLPVQAATGGNVSFVNGFFTHEFTGSDDLVVLAPIPAAEYIIVGGGGGGGQSSFNAPGSGGGAGGYLSSVSGETGAGGSATASPVSLPQGTIAITVGAGGGGASSENSPAPNGGDSSIAGIDTAIGGGGGGGGVSVGADGGSGGGGGNGFSPGSGTPGQGFDGAGGNSENAKGAGGGAGSAGSQGTSVTPGVISNTLGNATEFAQGGGGATTTQDGSSASTPGGGGGGVATISSDISDGGQSGVVIVRYQ